jgi:hypothetical protein
MIWDDPRKTEFLPIDLKDDIGVFYLMMKAVSKKLLKNKRFGGETSQP